MKDIILNGRIEWIGFFRGHRKWLRRPKFYMLRVSDIRKDFYKEYKRMLLEKLMY